jgi:hypothetical protein
MEKLFTPDFRTVLTAAASLITDRRAARLFSSAYPSLSVRPMIAELVVRAGLSRRRSRVRGRSRLFVDEAIDRGVASILKYARVV